MMWERSLMISFFVVFYTWVFIETAVLGNILHSLDLLKIYDSDFNINLQIFPMLWNLTLHNTGGFRYYKSIRKSRNLSVVE